MRNHQNRMVMAVALCFVWATFWAAGVHATPYFSIGHGRETSWGDAMTNGNLQFADSLTGAAQAFYGTQVPMMGFNSFALAEQGQLVPVNSVADSNGQTFDSLVMGWEPMGTDVLTVAAWDYVYDVDPDLTNAVIDFSLLGCVFGID